MINPPWWFCTGWWSPWCWLDIATHELGVNRSWICALHDTKVEERLNRKFPF